MVANYCGLSEACPRCSKGGGASVRICTYIRIKWLENTVKYRFSQPFTVGTSRSNQSVDNSVLGARSVRAAALITVSVIRADLTLITPLHVHCAAVHDQASALLSTVSSAKVYEK